MIGWGDMHGNQTFSQKLQEAEVPIRNLTECQKNYALLGQKMDMVRDHNICAGMQGKDSCYVRIEESDADLKKIALMLFTNGGKKFREIEFHKLFFQYITVGQKI